MEPRKSLGPIPKSILSTNVGNVMIAVYADTPSASALRAMGESQRRFADRQHGPFGFFSFCATGVGLPDAEAREVIGEISRTLGPRAAAAAIVLPGTGFWYSAARSVIDAATRLSSAKRAKQSIFDAIDPASRWIATLVGAHSETSGLLAGAMRDLVVASGLDERGTRVTPLRHSA